MNPIESQRYAIWKRAAEQGVTATIRYYAKRFPHLVLKETTIRRIKNAYLLEMKSNPGLAEPETDEAVPIKFYSLAPIIIIIARW